MAKDYFERRKQLTKQALIFDNFNQKRLGLVYSQMDPFDAETLQTIPVLLHYNQLTLPGFSETETDGFGVTGFHDSEDIRSVTQKVLSRAPWQNQTVKRRMIQSLCLMGSLGTIAQTKKSDADFWVIIDESEFDEDAYRELEKKCRKIENWCRIERRFECHLFINDISKLKQNKFGESDEESCGTALAKLLKEEFYRTVIVVNGKKPAWWLLPAGLKVSKTDKFLSFAKKELSNFDDYLDLGHLDGIGKDEYFGAALWQMSKFIHSPFKSLIKMGLLISYLKLDARLLCEKLKIQLIKDSERGRISDPYIILFESVVSYYHNKEDWKSFELLQKCFYLKTGLQISRSKDKTQSKDPRMTAMLQFISKWGWSRKLISEMDSIGRWEIESVHKFGLEIQGFLLDQYRVLRNEIRGYDENVLISEQDLHIIGQKLAAALGQKPGKIEKRFTYFFPGKIRDNDFRISYIDGHFLASRQTKSGERREPYKEKSLCKLITWLVYNQLIGAKSRLKSENSLRSLGIKDEDLISLMNKVLKLCKESNPFQTDHEVFLKPPVLKRVLLVLNLEKSSAEFNPADNTLKLSDDFSGFKWLDVNLLHVNTHDELFFEKISTASGLGILLERLDALFGSSAEIDFSIWIPKKRAEILMAEKLKSLFSSFFQPETTCQALSYHQKQYVLYERDGDKSKVRSIYDQKEIFRHLVSNISDRRVGSLYFDPVEPFLKELSDFHRKLNASPAFWGIYSRREGAVFKTALLGKNNRVLWLELIGDDPLKASLGLFRLICFYQASQSSLDIRQVLFYTNSGGLLTELRQAKHLSEKFSLQIANNSRKLGLVLTKAKYVFMLNGEAFLSAHSIKELAEKVVHTLVKEKMTDLLVEFQINDFGKMLPTEASKNQKTEENSIEQIFLAYNFEKLVNNQSAAFI